MQVKKNEYQPAHTHKPKTVEAASSDHSGSADPWTYCRLFPVYIRNKYSPMCTWLGSALR